MQVCIYIPAVPPWTLDSGTWLPNRGFPPDKHHRHLSVSGHFQAASEHLEISTGDKHPQHQLDPVNSSQSRRPKSLALGTSYLLSEPAPQPPSPNHSALPLHSSPQRCLALGSVGLADYKSGNPISHQQWNQQWAFLYQAARPGPISIFFLNLCPPHPVLNLPPPHVFDDDTHSTHHSNFSPDPSGNQLSLCS